MHCLVLLSICLEDYVLDPCFAMWFLVPFLFKQSSCSERKRERELVALL